MKRDEQQAATWAQMGIASLIPGMRYMIERMQRELDQMLGHLATLQGPPPEVADNTRVYLEKRKGGSYGWPADPAERKAEMARRRAAADANKQLGPMVNHPRDPRHPGHERWLANLRKAQKKYWNRMTPAQRKAKIAAMSAHRKPAVKMESAA